MAEGFPTAPGEIWNSKMTWELISDIPCKLSPLSPVPIPSFPEILATLPSTVYIQLSTHITAYSYRFIVFIFMCFCLNIHAREGRCLWDQKRAAGIPELVVSELFDIGVGKQTWVFCKNRTCLWLLSYLSSPDIPIFLYLATWHLDYLGKYIDYLGNCSQMDLARTYLSQRHFNGQQR